MSVGLLIEWHAVHQDKVVSLGISLIECLVNLLATEHGLLPEAERVNPSQSTIGT